MRDVGAYIGIMQSRREDSITITRLIILLLVKTIEARVTFGKVERIFVASTTSRTYSDKIILFMLWIFDTRGEFLVQEYIFEFECMSHEEIIGFQQREEDENVTKRRKINPINDITLI